MEEGVAKNKAFLRNRKTLLVFGLAILGISIVFLLFFVFNDLTETFGQFGNETRGLALSCSTRDINTDLTRTYSAKETIMRFDMYFETPDMLTEIKMNYSLEYNNEEDAKSSYNAVDWNYNLAMQKTGLVYGELGSKVVLEGKTLSLKLQASGDDINEKTADLFLTSTTENGKYPKSVLEFRANYLFRGFVCGEIQ